MTFEEEHKHLYEEAYKYLTDRSAAHLFNAEENPMIRIAIKAVEKQIPKKPKRMKNVLLKAYGWGYACPACGSAVGENRHGGGEFTQQDNYCATCGQKLTWGNEK